MRLAKVGHTGITWPFTPDGATQAIQDVASLGYQGIELFGFVLDVYPDGIEQVRSELAAAGLAFAASYCPAPLIEPETRAADIERMDAWADQVVELGGDVLVIGASPRKRATYTSQEYQGLCATLDEIGKRCADKGVTACFHPHTGTPVETPEEIERVMDGIDPAVVFMAPDTGQIAKGGGDPVETIRTYASMVKHIHLKDYIGGEPVIGPDGEETDRTGYLDYLPLGEGVVDVPSVIDVLEVVGYDGWWMVELDGTREATRSPLEAARSSIRYLDRLTREPAE